MISSLPVMSEVLAEATRLINLPFTLLLGLILFYWMLVAIGLLDMHLFSDGDFDLHTDAHTDLDGDGDLDFHGDPHLHGDKGLHLHGGSWWAGPLTFVNVGQVPVMIVVSVLSLCLWVGALLSNYYIARDSELT